WSETGFFHENTQVVTRRSDRKPGFCVNISREKCTIFR
ncbi:hypothetical protein AVDCRST_MAG84-3222, partial [uncultured Microcoleus sp.]